MHNGILPERTIQTGIGNVEIKVPKVRDRSGSGIYFNNSLLPPYLKRSSSIEELLPWLYLRGISTGDYQEALGALLGDKAKGLSANTISRLKQHWSDEHREWSLRDLSQKRYVYCWADGIYSNVRIGDRLCLLVIIGVTEHGNKELVAVEDGALGFWRALAKCYLDTVHQQCWVHKTANKLAALPKSVHPKVKDVLHEIWMAETRDEAHTTFDRILARFEAKYPKAMEKLTKDRGAAGVL